MGVGAISDLLGAATLQRSPTTPVGRPKTAAGLLGLDNMGFGTPPSPSQGTPSPGGPLQSRTNMGISAGRHINSFDPSKPAMSPPGFTGAQRRSLADKPWSAVRAQAAPQSPSPRRRDTEPRPPRARDSSAGPRQLPPDRDGNENGDVGADEAIKALFLRTPPGPAASSANMATEWTSPALALQPDDENTAVAARAMSTRPAAAAGPDESRAFAGGAEAGSGVMEAALELCLRLHARGRWGELGCVLSGLAQDAAAAAVAPPLGLPAARSEDSPFKLGDNVIVGNRYASVFS